MSRAGSLDRLRQRNECIGPPGPGEARVAICAIGLNFADVFACLGLYSATPSGPFIPGLEFSGVVEEVGQPPACAPSTGTSPWHPGDRVVGLTRFGAYATSLNVDVRYLDHLRPDWSFAEGAAYPVQALTAWYGLNRLGGLKPGDAVLVHSAAGGVGLNALAMIRTCAGLVVATVGTEAKKAFLLEHQHCTASQVIVRNRRRFGGQLDEALEAQHLDGFDIVFDGVAGPFFRPGYDRLRRGGRLVIYGAADFMSPGRRPNYARLAIRYLRRPRLDPLAMITDNKNVMGFNLIWMWDRVDGLVSMYRELAPILTSPPCVGRIFPFAKAPEAVRHLQSGQSMGKVVIEVPFARVSAPSAPFR